MNIEAQIRAGHPEMRCKNGHVVMKFKDILKPWQGRMRSRQCGVCGKIIERDEPHWRCEEHCAWDICHKCFGDHWTRVIKAAAATENLDIKRRLLEAVPESRQILTDYKEAKKGLYRPPPPPVGVSPEKAGKYLQSAASSAASPQEDRGQAKKEPKKDPSAAATQSLLQPAQKESRKVTFKEDPCEWWKKYELQICIATILVVSPLSLITEKKLLADKSLQFPSPWLMVGFVNLLAAGLLRIVMCIVQPNANKAQAPVQHMPMRAGWVAMQQPPADPEVPWKQAAIVGGMHAVELGIAGFIVRYNALGTRNELYSFMPGIFLLAGIMSQTERVPLPNSLTGALVCMAIGAILACPSPFQAVSWKQLPLALLAGVITGLRWIWTNNIFPAERNVRPPETMKSALVFASRMSPTTGVTGLELTFITSVAELGALLAIFKTPNPLAIVGLLLVMACCAAAVLVAELRLVQLSSATLLGFLGPAKQAVTTLLYAPLFLGDPKRGLLWWILCAVFCAAGIYLFVDARRPSAKEGTSGHTSTGSVMTYAPEDTYYRRMYAQEGQRRSDFV